MNTLRRRRLPWLLLLPLLLAPACAERSRPSGDAGLPSSAALELDNRATLLLLADRRELVRMPLDRALLGGPQLREDLAVALGRIGDPQGRAMLEGLAVDEAVAVRRAAVFGLGELGVREAEARLLVAATDADREVGALAVEALGKIGASLAEIRPRLAALGEVESEARLLPFLFRFHEPAALEVGRATLFEKASPWRGAAAYGIARYPRPEAAPILRELLADADPAIQAIAARGLGEVGDPGDLAPLRRTLDAAIAEGADSPAIQAMRAGAKLRGRSHAAAPADEWAWPETLGGLFAHPSAGVRTTALEAAASFAAEAPAESALVAALAERWEHAETTRERELALLALAVSAAPVARTAVRQAATNESAVLRAAAAAGAGRVGDLELLTQLASDPSPRVRLAVLEARLVAPPAEAAAWARQALTDADPPIRSTALDWWAEHPGLPVEALVAAAAAGRPATELEDDRLAAVRALAGLAKARIEERGACLLALDALTRDGSYLVRREAIQALRGLGETPAPLAPLETRRQLSAYRDILQQTARPRFVAMETARGRLLLELACREAPMTCLSFLHLAEGGYFDGQVFHRVVPDFVIQAGDPRGDGWGGPGYTLRDEINRLRYQPGALGMALSGPDTGGSQFFLTLTAQPHLDGGYTVFGHLVEGAEVAARIVQGDTIVRVREVAGRASAAKR